MRLSLYFATILTAATLFAANPPGVPKEARETSPGQYSFRDSSGKTWIYRQTPFGIQKAEDKGDKPAESAAASKTEEKPAPAPGTAMPTPFGQTRSRGAVPVRVTEKGDTLEFERQTPFGAQRWSRSKSELTETEKQLWEAHRNSDSPKKSK